MRRRIRNVTLTIAVLLASTFAAANTGYSNLFAIDLRTGGRLPVVFIPGVAGSKLVDGGDTLWPPTTTALYNDLSQLSLFSSDQPSDSIVATDVIRELGGDPVYGGFLEFLKGAGYSEYDVADNPDRRTTLGCDDSGQAGDNPELFVFA